MPFQGHTGPVSSVSFSSDGTHVVSGSYDKTIRVWDARTGLLITGPFQGHADWVMSVGFSHDGTHIVSGSDDNAIRVWATTPLQVHDPGHLNDWFMDETGMITTQQRQLLLCIPVDLWIGLVWPQNTVCIYGKGVFRPDFNGVLLGREWTKCYASCE
ncbi:WD40 repeat-like protein [Ceratobasidium sp. AG-I]|nr:WD40 repeat-like protein [Ceratobasidium sp. AG-I]